MKSTSKKYCYLWWLNIIHIVSYLHMIHLSKWPPLVHVVGVVSKCSFSNSWRKAMSSESGPLQVVPEIDIEIDKPNQDAKCGDQSRAQKTDTKSLHTKAEGITSSLGTLSADGQEVDKEAKAVRSGRRRSSVHPPVERINYDAVPLTTAEVEAHQQFFGQIRTWNSVQTTVLSEDLFIY